ncbi:MAG: TIGR02221 family CRISPR-associated protein [Methanolinea sp.]|nr:TIGR02221 family CRISPR-associated protein [Methanolinea sp.]
MSRRTLLSFVGAGPLVPTVYAWQGREVTTPVIQEALAEFFSPGRVVLFSTAEASQKNLPEVARRVPACEEVRIPSGRSEPELWEIFSTVAGTVGEEDAIVFDITHGFRSLPFIAFLSSAYIREVRGARLEAVVYGALEAREGDKTPVFDLTPFVRILDWMGAVRSFAVHGDASGIRGIVDESVAREFREERGDRGLASLREFAARLEAFTLAARMSRPVEAGNFAGRIRDLLPGARGEAARLAPPLGCILDRVEAIGDLAADYPGGGGEIGIPHLQAQRRLVGYQVERGLYMQAVTLAREWIVSLAIVARGEGEGWLEKEVREAAEQGLNAHLKEKRGEKFKPTEYYDWVARHTAGKSLVDAWNRIANIRNDIAHCGMNKTPKKSRNSVQEIGEIPGILEELETLFLPPRA